MDSVSLLVERSCMVPSLADKAQIPNTAWIRHEARALQPWRSD